MADMNDDLPKKGITHYLKIIGPGLLFAGAAVGVSHLYLSTKAGAEFGMGLLWIVLLANLLKYPFFEFGPRYTAATGTTLLDGYKKLGNWVLVVFFIMTFFSMFSIQAAVTVVTAGLASNFLPLGEHSAVIWSAIILTLCFLILAVRKFSLLDNIMKVIIVSLTIFSIIAVIFALNGGQATDLNWTFELPTTGAGLALFVGIIGWMPGPIDLSVWYSLWAKAKNTEDKKDFSLKNTLLDFNIGYAGTAILALCFLALGALVMFNSGTSFSSKGSVFAQQLIDVYSSTLGSSLEYIIGGAALITMFSTSFTCLDALPRSMAKTTALFNENKPSNENKYYWIWLIGLISGTILILLFFITDMALMIKVATILSFLTAPFFAITNYLLVTHKDIPKSLQPKKWLRILSILGMIFLVGFSIFYISTLI